MAHIFAEQIRRTLIFFGLIRKPDYIVRLVDQHPVDDEIRDGIIYVVGTRDYQKWAYFRSPTDRSEIIQLSLMKKHRPCWRVDSDWLQRVTIHPSVRQTAGSFAHFWVRRGMAEICGDSGIPLHQN
ncbi:MAG: DUF6527 family protein [Pseudomonadota bacterium]|jgi:hypothetical protein